MLQIMGVPFSAHTRKVIIAAIEKQIPYELQMVVPLDPPQGWSDLSPLGKIPVVRDGDVTLPDSSVICQYLERRYPDRSIYPKDPATLGRALWLEEYVDGGLSPHVLNGLLLQRVFAPKFLNLEPDQALIDTSLNEKIPPILASLERSVYGPYLAGDAFSIADITVASMLINFHYAGEEVDEATYPKLYRWLRDILRRPCFQTAFETEIPAAEQVGDLDMRLLRDATVAV